MPTGSYSRQNFYDDVKRDAGSITNIDRLANRAARFVVSDVDLRSTKRMAYLSPNLNENQYDYQAPADMKEYGIIDVRRLEGRKEEDKFDLVQTDYFDRNKSGNKNLICVEDRDWLKKLRISAETREESAKEVVLHECDSITTDGTWAVSGNASNLTLDTDNFVHGEASLNFDMAASYTSASAVVTGMGKADISDFETGGSAFALIYIPDATGLTSINLKVRSSSTQYFRQSRTVTNENLSFYVGWNLFRLDFAGATETGTTDMDNIDELEIGIVGDGTAAASTDWRIDYVVARRGKPHEVWYYTKNAWQNTGGTSYLENSTATTDKLNADIEEYEGFVLKFKELISQDREEFDSAANYNKMYENWKARYMTKYPSERLLMKQSYYKFNSNVDRGFLN